MKELLRQVDNLERDVEKLKSLQDSGGGGGTVTAVTASSPLASSGGTTPDISLNNSGVSAGTYTNATIQVNAKGLVTSASSGTAPVTSVGVTAPVTSTGGTTPTIGLSVTPANPGGAVALQGSYPGTQQTGNANLSGSINAGTTYYKAGVEWLGQGTSFPGSPTTNQRYFRTDRGIEYYYDGTRWLSVQQFKQPFISRSNQPFAQATTSFDLNFSEYSGGGGLYIYGLNISFLPNSVAQSTTNFYTVNLGVIDTSGAITTITLTGSNDTKAFTTLGSWRPLVPTFTAQTFTSLTIMMAFCQFVPTNNPGTWFANVSLAFRLIG